MTAPSDPLSGDHAPGLEPPDDNGMPLVPREPHTLETLTAEARHHRQRYDLYRARMYGSKPTSEQRLRELQRWCESAEARLAAAKAARPPE